MCSHKMDSQIYSKLTALTETHVKSNIKIFFADSMDKLVSGIALTWKMCVVIVVVVGFKNEILNFPFRFI